MSKRHRFTVSGPVREDGQRTVDVIVAVSFQADVDTLLFYNDAEEPVAAFAPGQWANVKSEEVSTTS